MAACEAVGPSHEMVWIGFFLIFFFEGKGRCCNVDSIYVFMFKKIQYVSMFKLKHQKV